MTTDEALESLLGKKAAKRLRRIAKEIADSDGRSTKNNKKKGSKTQKKKKTTKKVAAS